VSGLRPPSPPSSFRTAGTSAAEFLTVEEAAAIVKVKPSTVYEWVRSGRLPCYRLGPRAIRFTPELLRRFAEENFDEGRGF
jgi:excisionase family DNA binding protein